MGVVGLSFGRIARGAALGLLGLVVATPASGALIASDDAGGYSAFNTTGATPANGGGGFGAWNLTVSNAGNTAQNGHFLATGNNVQSQLNTGGNAWAMYANASQLASAARPLTGGALAAGQHVTWNMDNGFIDNAGAVGASLWNASGLNVWEIYFTGGQSNYTVNAGSVTGSTPAYTNQGLSVDFVLTSPTTYSATVKRFIDASPVTLTGNLLNPAGGQGITQLRFFDYSSGASNASDHDFFFNSIAVTPEPGSVAVVGLGALAGLVRRRRA